MDYTDRKFIEYVVKAKLKRILETPDLVDNDITLPDGTFIPAGTDMDTLTEEQLNSLEKYYEENNL